MRLQRANQREGRASSLIIWLNWYRMTHPLSYILLGIAQPVSFMRQLSAYLLQREGFYPVFLKEKLDMDWSYPPARFGPLLALLNCLRKPMFHRLRTRVSASLRFLS